MKFLLSIPDGLHKELRREAFEKEVSVTSLILGALRDYGYGGGVKMEAGDELKEHEPVVHLSGGKKILTRADIRRAVENFQ